MPKTTFDPDELDDRSGRLNKAAGRLDGIGSRATSAASDLMGDPWAGALAAQVPGIFTNLPSIRDDLHETARSITATVQQYRDRQSGGPPSPPGWLASALGPAAPPLFQAADKDLQSWWKKHGHDIESALHSTVKSDVNNLIPGVPLWSMASTGLHDAGTWYEQHRKTIQADLEKTAAISGMVAGAAGFVAMLPIPGVDVAAEALTEVAGVVNVGADAALLATGDDTPGVEADMAMAGFGLLTGGASRTLGEGAELVGDMRYAGDAEKAAKDAEAARNAAAITRNEKVAKAVELDNQSKTPVVGILARGKHIAAEQEADRSLKNLVNAEADAKTAKQVAEEASQEAKPTVSRFVKAATGISTVSELKNGIKYGFTASEKLAWHGGGLGLAQTGLQVAANVGDLAKDFPPVDQATHATVNQIFGNTSPS